MIQLLKQTRRSNCGQTAMAMLTGKTIEQMEKLYRKKTATFAYEHVIHARTLGFNCTSFVDYKGQQLPDLALVRMGFLRRRCGKLSSSGKTKRRGHLVLYSRGDFYDPSGVVYSQRGIPSGMVIDSFLAVEPQVTVALAKPRTFRLGDTLPEQVFAALPHELSCPKCGCTKPKAEFGVRVVARDAAGLASKVIRQSYCKPCRR